MSHRKSLTLLILLIFIAGNLCNLLPFASASVVFADGFESGSFGAWTGVNYGSPSVVKSDVNSGVYSMKAPATTDSLVYKTLGSSYGSLYVRAYVKYSSLSVNGRVESILVGTSSSDFDAQGGVYVDGSGNTYWNVRDFGGTYTYLKESIFTGTYYCMELYVQRSSGIISLWVNGVLKINVTAANVGGSNFNTVCVGSSDFASIGGYVSVDDVVVANSYIGPISGVGSPVVSNVSASPIFAGGSCVFSSFWSDNVSLGGFVFSTNNTGVWQNDSWVPFLGTPSWARTSKVLSSVVGSVVGYRWFVNDSSGVWVGSGVQNLTVQSSPVVFIDGFESGTYSAWTNTYSSGATLGVSSAYAHSGGYSSKINVTSSMLGNTAYSFENVAAVNALYAREYVYFTSFGSLTSGHGGSVLTIYDSSNYGARILVCFYDSSGTFKWALNNGDIVSNVTVPLNTWICVETYYDSTTHLSSLWVNGVAAITGYTSNNIGSGTTVDEIWSGEAFSDVNENGTVLYLDDVVVGGSYIGPGTILNMGSPTVSGVSASPIFAGGSCVFSSFWSDNVSLGGFVFSTNNTGVWQNDSWVPFLGTPSWARTSKVLSSVVGSVVGYRWFVNDSSGVWVGSGVQNLTVQSSPVVFIDGFESGTYSAWTNTYSSGATLGVSSAYAHSGGYSSKINVTSSMLGNTAYSFENVAAVNALYAREYVYFTSFGSLTSGHGGSVLTIYDSSNYGARILVCFYDSSGTFKWALNNGDIVSNVTVPLNTWICVETYYDSTTHLSSLWVNGVAAITGYTSNNIGSGTTVDEILTGEERSALNENGTTFYLDDVAVASSYIGPMPIVHGAVALTFDDDDQSQYDYAFPIMQAHGMVGTFYVITSAISDFSYDSRDYMSLAELHALQNSGNEIGSHTVTHPYLTSLTDQQINYECNVSQQILRANGFTANNFAYPYGDTDPHVDSIVSQYYSSARQAYGLYNENPVMTFPISYFSLPDDSDGNGNNSTLPSIENIVDQVYASNSFAIIVIHQVFPNITAPETISTQDLSSFLDYVASKGVATLTINQALNEIPSTLSASRLVFSVGGNQSLVAGQVSSVVTVQRQDQFGNPVTFGNLTVSLGSNSSGGVFYSDAGSTVVSSVTIVSGSSSVSFWYRDSVVGSSVLKASSSGLTSANTTLTVQSVPVVVGSPVVSNVSASPIFAGGSCVFSSFWSDNVSLGGFVFSTNNTGVWQNDSWVPFLGTPSWGNVSKVLSSVVGSVVGYRWFVNDSSGVWVGSGVQNLTVQSVPVVFADGFESGSFGAWTGVNYGSPSVVKSDVNSGVYSMKAPATTDSLVYKTLGSSYGSLYVRAYVKYSSLSVNGRVESVAVGTSSSNLAAQGGVYIDGSGNTYWNIRGSTYTNFKDSIVTGTYYCMELYVQRSSGTVSLWVNGVLKINATGVSLGGSDFNTVCVGSSDFASIGGYVSVDDVVVANSYIGPISGVGSPVVSNVSASPIFAGGSCVFSSFWSDNVSLGGFVFSTNNTGVWQNDSWVPFLGTPSWGNVSKVLSSVVGSVVGYRWFVNDSSGVWVGSGVQNLTVQSVPVVFADGFESGSFGAWTGVNYGSPSVVKSDVNSGVYSMKAPATTDSLVYKTLGSSYGSLYVRAYVKYSSLSVNGRVESILVGTSSSDFDAQGGVYVDGSGNTYWNVRDFGGTYTYLKESIFTGTYYCMELYVQRSSGIISLWVNGVLKINVTAANVGGSNFNTVCVGSSDFASIGGYVSVDDVVVANSYIGPISASRLVFSVGGNQSLVAGQVSSVVTVQRQDQFGNPVTFGNLTVSLGSNSSGGVFYSDAGSTVVSSVTIVSGSSSVSFWYRDSVVGSSVLKASSSGLTSANTTFKIGVG